MRRIEPALIPVVTDLERGLRALGVPFGVVGALVPELLLDAPPPRMTNDADVTVTVQTLEEFGALKERLRQFGFTPTRMPHRMGHTSGGIVDVLPYSESIAGDGVLRLEEDVVMNMAGFDKVIPHAVTTEVEGGPTLPLAPLPLYVLLKLVAFSDRKAGKDLGSVLHCLEHYLEHDDRRYGLDHDGSAVPYDYTCAYLLGIDGREFLDLPLRKTVTAILDRFTDVDADVVHTAVAEKGRLLIADDERSKAFELFRWYRLGVGL